MQNIKSLGIKTKEGLEVKNYQTFPSLEWGDDGGMQADVYFKGKYLARVLQEGNGGCANVYMQVKNETEWADFKTACYNFLIRKDKDFGPQSKYEFMRNKTPETINDDDIESVVNLIARFRDSKKQVAKLLKKGFKTIFEIDKGFQTMYLSFRVDDATEEEAISYLKKHNESYEEITKFNEQTNFNAI